MTKDAWIEDAMELNSVVCAAYKMGCDQTREVYQKRIEKLEAALEKIAQHDMQAIAMDALRPGERIRKAPEGKDD